MNILNAFTTEAKFAVHDRSVVIWVLMMLSLSFVSVFFGLTEVNRQHSEIHSLLESDQQDRAASAKKLKSWGSAAYYSFHLTYDAPSTFAFAALGQRDLQPWKHRIRMLALEGQIYERDVGNPVIELIGRFDFAFLATFILPLVIIILLYDLRASERTSGRYELLESTVACVFTFWFARAGVRVVAIFFSLMIPLIIGGVVAGASIFTVMSACLIIFIYTSFWFCICYFFASWRKSGSVILLTLISVWLLLTVIMPAGARLLVDKLVPVPSGAEILLLQRETVNDAWDLPREVTMLAFFEQHPQWSDYEPIESSFEWQWYYAFQQVGDQRAEPLTRAYRNGRLKRDRIASWLSLLTPPSFFERSLQSLAKTDLSSSIDYEDQVRDYHVALREFYYPKFFRNMPFDKFELEKLPRFSQQK